MFGFEKHQTKNQNGEARILKDQFKQIQIIHENRYKVDERSFHPSHDKRAKTPTYKEIHNEMVVNKEYSISYLRGRHSTLDDESNRPSRTSSRKRS